MTEHPGMALTDVYAAIIPDFSFKPGVHVRYQETVPRIHDGLAKMQDVSAEMGRTHPLGRASGASGANASRGLEFIRARGCKCDQPGGA